MIHSHAGQPESASNLFLGWTRQQWDYADAWALGLGLTPVPRKHPTEYSAAVDLKALWDTRHTSPPPVTECQACNGTGRIPTT